MTNLLLGVPVCVCACVRVLRVIQVKKAKGGVPRKVPITENRKMIEAISASKKAEMSARKAMDAAVEELARLRMAGTLYRPLSARAAQLYRAIQSAAWVGSAAAAAKNGSTQVTRPALFFSTAPPRCLYLNTNSQTLLFCCVYAFFCHVMQRNSMAPVARGA